MINEDGTRDIYPPVPGPGQVLKVKMVPCNCACHIVTVQTTLTEFGPFARVWETWGGVTTRMV